MMLYASLSWDCTNFLAAAAAAVMLLFQTRYDALDKGSVLPLSLYADVVRITKLALY
jgi:hypothetical protein